MHSLRLKISVSGVRGIVGETLTPQLLIRFAQAYGTYVGPGKVLIGRDTRTSGPMVSQAVCAGLLAVGCQPIEAGIAPTPTIQYRCATRTDTCGAIVITASHNPEEWNALKLLTGEGLFLSRLQSNELLGIYHQGAFRRAHGAQIPKLSQDTGALSAHLRAVLSQVDLPLIKGADLTVAADCVNGAGAVITPRFFEELGCKASILHGEPSGRFARPPEPLPKNLTALRELVKGGAATVGFAQDADADRLAVVDEGGRAIDGDLMLALLIDRVLRRTPGPVVVNLSTSNLIDHVAATHKVPLYRSPVGEANVVEEMLAQGAVVGGEGSGGLIYPAIHHCRDSLIGMALLLEYLAQGGNIANWVDALPARVRRSEKIPLSSTSVARSLLFTLRHELKDAALDLRDGVKATWPEGWLHVRASNTEPVLRLILEAEDQTALDGLRQRVEEILPLTP